MVYAFFEANKQGITKQELKETKDKILGRKTGKVYSNPTRQPQTTSSTSAPKPKVGAEKLSDLSQRLEKAINKIVGSATVATKKKTPPVKPKKKTPPKKKAPTKSGGGVGGFGKFSTINRARNKKVDLNKPFDV